MRLDPPVLVPPGERYWFDWGVSLLFVEDENGVCRSFPAAWPDGPDAIRERLLPYAKDAGRALR